MSPNKSQDHLFVPVGIPILIAPPVQLIFDFLTPR